MTQKEETVMERIRALVSASGLSYDELAKRCEVSGMTVRRVLSEEPKNPSFFLLCDIINVCGGSVDDILGVSHRDAPPVTVPNDPLVVQLKAEARRDRHRAELYGRIIAGLVTFVFFVLIFFIIDLLNPNVGWIRRSIIEQAHYGVSTRAAIMCALPWWLG